MKFKTIKNVLITGSSSGLGFSLSRDFKDKGYNVYGISRSETNLPIKQVKYNLGDLENINEMLKTFIDVKEFEYVILNAAILGRLDTLNNLSIEDYQEIFNINVFSNKIILDYLLKNNKIKNVIGISSKAAINTYYGWSLYCCSKALFKQIISSYSDEFPDVNFISLNPGAMKSKMQDTIYNEDENRIPSIKKLRSLYPSMDSPDIASNEIIKHLDKIMKYGNGNFLNLKDIL